MQDTISTLFRQIELDKGTTELDTIVLSALVDAIKQYPITDIKKFQEIMVASGALQYVQELASGLVAEAKKSLTKKAINSEAEDFLLSVADYMVARKN